MENLLGVLMVPMVVFMVVVAPIWLVLHYRAKGRIGAGLADSEREQLPGLLAPSLDVTDAIVPAAGKSARMGGEDKMFSQLCGVPVLARLIKALPLPLVAPRPLAEAISTSSTLARVTGKEVYRNWYATFLQYLDADVIDHKNGSWFHQLDKNNHVIGTVWPGKSDLYHATQCTLIPRLDPAVSVAPALKANPNA